MDIHVVQPGDTLYQLARQYGVSMDQLLRDNQLPNPAQLVVGQTIVVRYPETVHQVKEGDTLWSIARMHQISVRQLLRNNPGLEGRDRLFPGQTLVVSFRHTPELPLSVNGYAYPSIDRALLEGTLPDLSRLTPFTYRFEEDSLVPLRDESLVRAALQMGTAPIFHLSNLDSQERFSPELAQELLEDREDQEELIEEIIETVGEKGYRGVDVDFEFVPGQDAERYAQFLDRLRRALSPRGLSLTAAVAPKTSDSQPGRAQEGHDYVKIPVPAGAALSGRPPLRLQLDPALAGWEPGGLPGLSAGGPAGLGPESRHPLRRDSPGPLAAVLPGRRGARGLVRGRPLHPGQAEPGAGIRPPRGQLLERGPPLPPELDGAQRHGPGPGGDVDRLRKLTVSGHCACSSEGEIRSACGTSMARAGFSSGAVV